MSDILIPYKYSKIAHLSSIIILKNSYLFYIYQEKLIGIMLFFSYIFTNLHWYRLKKTGFIRNIDIFIVITTFTISLYRSFFYNCFLYYIVSSCITIFIFLLNEFLNSKTIYLKNFKNKKNTFKILNYTRCVLFHTFFLHIFQTEAGIYVVKNC